MKIQQICREDYFLNAVSSIKSWYSSMRPFSYLLLLTNSKHLSITVNIQLLIEEKFKINTLDVLDLFLSNH